MAFQNKKKGPVDAARILDYTHIGIGIIIVVLAVVSFLNPEGNMALFPLIFLLAGIMNLMSGLYHLRECGRDKKKKISAVAGTVIGALLVLLCIVSGISIWG